MSKLRSLTRLKFPSRNCSETRLWKQGHAVSFSGLWSSQILMTDRMRVNKASTWYMW